MQIERSELSRQLRFKIEEEGVNQRFVLPKVVDPEIVSDIETVSIPGEGHVYTTGLFADLRSGEHFRFNVDSFQEQYEVIQPAAAAIVITSKISDPEGEDLNSLILNTEKVLADRGNIYIFEERDRKSKGTSVISGLKGTHIRNIEVFWLAYFSLFVGIYKQDETTIHDLREHPSVEAGRRAAKLRARHKGFQLAKLTWEELDARLAQSQNPSEDIKLARLGRGSLWQEDCGCTWRIDLKGGGGVVSPCDSHREGWGSLQYK